MRVDTHHHFWNYSAEQYPWIAPSMQILRQNYGPNELEPEITHAGIDGVISVQARQTTEETQWLLEIAEQKQLRGGRSRLAASRVSRYRRASLSVL